MNFIQRGLASACSILVAVAGSGAVYAEDKEKALNHKPEVLLTRVERALTITEVNSLQKHIIDYTFSPSQAMPAYRQLLLWASDLEGGALKQDVYSLVWEGLISVIRDSGAGVPLSDWEGRGKPISVSYGLSLPRYNQYPNFDDSSTLRWSSTGESRVVTPVSVGQSLATKALFVLLDSEHSDGKDVILASAIEELNILVNQMFLSGEKLGGLAEGGYVPEMMAFDENNNLELRSGDSRLSSQAYLLQGLAHIWKLLSHESLMSKMAGGDIRGKSIEEWRGMARQALDQTYQAMITHHYNSSAGTFVSDYPPGKKRGDRIMLDDLFALSDALRTLVEMLPSDDALAQSAKEHLAAQAVFLKAALEGNKNKARIPRGFLLKKKIPLYNPVQNLSYSIAIMSLLLAAEEVVGDGEYKKYVEEDFSRLQKVFWSVYNNVYRSADGYKVSAYDGQLFAMVLGWLQSMHRSAPELADFSQQGKDLFEAVIKHGGMLQAEGPANGEPKTPEEYVAEDAPLLVDELMTIKLSEHSILVERLVGKASDQDGDGVPGVRYAWGGRGSAPVLVTQTSVSTPFVEAEKGVKGQYRRGYGL